MKSKKFTISDLFPELNCMLKIIKWCKKGGENISRGDILLEIIVKIKAVKNQMISPQTVIAQIIIT